MWDQETTTCFFDSESLTPDYKKFGPSGEWDKIAFNVALAGHEKSVDEIKRFYKKVRS